MKSTLILLIIDLISCSQRKTEAVDCDVNDSKLKNCICEKDAKTCATCENGFYDTQCDSDCSHCNFREACQERFPNCVWENDHCRKYACYDNDYCIANFINKPLCINNECIFLECQDDSECSGRTDGLIYCLNNKCAQCKGDSYCTNSEYPICNAEGKCVHCKSNSECIQKSIATNASPKIPKCDENGKCVSECTGSDNEPCLYLGKLTCENGECTDTCTNDNQCTNPFKRACGNGTPRVCIPECNDDNELTVCTYDVKFPFCFNGKCSECKEDSNCSGKKCFEGNCVETCSEDSDCSIYEKCDKGICINNEKKCEEFSVEEPLDPYEWCDCDKVPYCEKYQVDDIDKCMPKRCSNPNSEDTNTLIKICSLLPYCQAVWSETHSEYYCYDLDCSLAESEDQCKFEFNQCDWDDFQDRCIKKNCTARGTGENCGIRGECASINNGPCTSTSPETPGTGTRNLQENIGYCLACNMANCKRCTKTNCVECNTGYNFNKIKTECVPEEWEEHDPSSDSRFIQLGFLFFAIVLLV